LQFTYQSGFTRINPLGLKRDSMTNDSLLAQLSEEFTEELRTGKPGEIEEYARKYPELAERIRELFPTLMMLEGMAAGGGAAREAPSSILAAGSIFGRYRIEREIGRGGMGIVYEAIHLMLEKRIALKVLAVRSMAEAGYLERFFREARTAAGLHHTNIVPVFDVGQVADTPYYAMQYIEGRGLNEVLKYSRADKGEETAPGAAPVREAAKENIQDYFRWVAGIGIQAAEGLSHAHERKVVHLDIKPSNLLLDKEGVVWIADFGLARTIEDPEMTRSGTVVGTPRYMSPEQAQAATHPVDHRSDIYSLGATLYELLTRRPVFEGKTPLEVISQILTREPVALQRLNREIPSDLATIVMKAMAKAPEDRYQSAQELADDLNRWLKMEPIHAKPIGPVGCTVRWCRRNPKLAAVTAAAAIMLLALSGIYYASLMKENAATRREFVRASEERDRANAARSQAESAERQERVAADLAKKSQIQAEAERNAADLQQREALYQSYRSNLLAADLSFRAGELDAARERLALCDPSLRGWEWRYLKRSVDMSIAAHTLPAPDVYFSNYGRDVREVAFDNDSKSIIINAYQVFPEDGTKPRSELLETSAFRFIPGDAGSFTKAASGGRVIAISPNGSLALSSAWNLKDGSLSCVTDGLGDVARTICRPVAFNDTPKTVAPEDWDRLIVTDTMSARVIATLRYPNLGVWNNVSSSGLGLRNPHVIGGTFNQDGSLLAIWSRDDSIYIWDLRTQSILSSLPGDRNTVVSVCFSPDSARVASSYSNGTIRLWLTNSGEKIKEFRASIARVLKYSPDGSHIALGTNSGPVLIYKADGNDAPKQLSGNTGAISSVAFSPDSKRLIAAAPNDRNIYLWDTASGQQLTTFYGHTEGVSSVAYSPDGSRIASGSRDGTVRVWNARSALSILKGHSQPLIAIGLTADGAGALSASADRTLKVWDTTEQNAVQAMGLDPNRPPTILSEVALLPGSAAINQDKYRYATSYLIPGSSGAARKFSTRVMDIKSGAQLFAAEYFDTRNGPLVMLTPDAARLAVASRNDKGGDVQFWEIKSGKLLASWTINGNRPTSSPAISPDGNLIAVSVQALTPSGPDPMKTAILVFSVDSPRVLFSIPGMKDIQFLRPAFLPNRTHIAFVGGDNVHVWDLHRRKEIAILKGHHNTIAAIATSSDGSRIVTGGSDGTVRIWDAARYELLLTLRLPANRSAQALAVSSDGATIAAGAIDGSIYLWYAAPLRER
jgi:eukaryotic-like serine/threonine-protein kinase